MLESEREEHGECATIDNENTYIQVLKEPGTHQRCCCFGKDASFLLTTFVSGMIIVLFVVITFDRTFEILATLVRFIDRWMRIGDGGRGGRRHRMAHCWYRRELLVLGGTP